MLQTAMDSCKYTPGSVSKLLGSELPSSGHETKLQVLFSKPPAQSSGFKRQAKVSIFK